MGLNHRREQTAHPLSMAMTSVASTKTSHDDRGELVQTCASVPLRNLEYLLPKKCDEKEDEIPALDFMEM